MHEATWSRDEAIALLDAPQRQRSENPATLWRRVGLRAGMTVVDIGAGTGHFALPAASIVGPRGRVFAVDLSQDLVELLRERVTERGLANVRILRSRPVRIPVPTGVADRVLLANLVHGVPPATLAEAVRLLRPGGRLVDVDWKKQPTEGGPPVAHRLSAEEARAALEPYGVRWVATSALGPAHYVVVLEKPTAT